MVHLLHYLPILTPSASIYLEGHMFPIYFIVVLLALVSVKSEGAPRAKANIIVSPTNLLTRENGASASFSVVLSTSPKANVTISVASSDPSEGQVNKSSLLFTPSNGLVPQFVTVTGVDDTELDGNVAYSVILALAQSLDRAYRSLNPADISVVNEDDEATDITAPLISHVSSTNITQSGCRILWDSDEPSTSQVEYGLTTIYGLRTAEIQSQVVAHTVDLSGLSPATLYHYRVISKDASGNISTSNDFTLTTLPTSDTPTEVVATAVSGSTAIMTWKDNSSSELGYVIERSPTPDFNLRALAGGTVGANETRYVDRYLRTPNTLYYYRVRAKLGNSTFSNYSNVVSVRTLKQLRAAVILFDFLDSGSEWPTRKVRSSAFYNDLYFNSHSSYITVHDYFRQFSNEKTEFVGKVFGPFVVPYYRSNCYPSFDFGILSSAIEMAKAAGLKFDDFDMIAYTTGTHCSLGSRGLTFAPVPLMQYSTIDLWATLESHQDAGTIIHELGHQLNYGHEGSTLACSDASGAAITLAATADECYRLQVYGNYYTPMGQRMVSFDGWESARMGMLTEENILTVTQSGEYEIAPLQDHASSLKTKLIRIPRETISRPDRGSYTADLYLEYRYGVGMDNNPLAFEPLSPEWVTSGALMTYAPQYSDLTEMWGAYLIDTTPQTKMGNALKMDPITGQLIFPTNPGAADAPLAAGQTFIDPLSGVQVTTLSTSPSSIKVKIDFSQYKQCTWAAASAKVLQSSVPVLSPGQTVTVSLKVTNNNSANCPKTNFYVESISSPALLEGTIVLSLSPGETQTIPVTITAASYSGSHNYFLKVRNPGPALNITAFPQADRALTALLVYFSYYVQ